MAEQQGVGANDQTPSLTPSLTPSFAGRRWAESLVEEERSSVCKRFTELPLSNQFLLGCALLLLCAIVIHRLSGPISAAGHSAVKPFTAEGKKESCLSHLASIQQALAMYRDDNGERLPLLDYGSGKNRNTWVSALSEYSSSESFLCPVYGVPGEQQALVSSYGLNPALAGTGGVKHEAASVIMLADRGKAHDVSLLPPFASWPAKKQPDEESANIAFRHGGQAAILYADGHADTASPGDWLQQISTWGGSLVQDVALDRLKQQHPALARLSQQMKANTHLIRHRNGQQIFRSLPVKQQRELRSATEPLLSLWKAGLAHDAKSSAVSATERMLWCSAGGLAASRDSGLRQTLNQELSRQSRHLLQQTQSGQWQSHQDSEGFACSVPPGWEVETKVEGRYHLTYLRSGSPHVFIMIEKSRRRTEGSSGTIDWSGMEKALEAKHGHSFDTGAKDGYTALGYLHLDMGEGMLGGQPVSTWQYDLQQADAPKMRKQYLGCTFPSSSYVVVCAAPSAEYENWESTFEAFLDSFEFRFE